ncbi:hypothetical protein [Streptococcus orisasini]|uniref:hypothetical protein n=1 Tax=Streptococcus orisasini TaxID=1080071 RepID=UPI00070F828B|nr:hypothetical protein [Streptococcus orisasini]
MHMKKLSSTTLRFIRLGASLMGLLSAHLCIYTVDNNNIIWLWLPLGILSGLSFVITYFAYKEIKKRPIAEQSFTQYQTQIGILTAAFLTLFLLLYVAVTTGDEAQRTALIIVLIILIITIIWNLIRFIKLHKRH